MTINTLAVQLDQLAEELRTQAGAGLERRLSSKPKRGSRHFDRSVATNYGRNIIGTKLLVFT
jgi:hypothetical protein